MLETRTKPQCEAPGGDRRGMAMVVVAAVVLIVSLGMMAFVANMSLENRASHIRGDEFQVDLVAESGVDFVRSVLTSGNQRSGGASAPLESPELFRGRVVLRDPTRGTIGRFTVISPRVDGDGNTTLKYGLTNESAKLNLETLVEWDRLRPGLGREALMQLPGMTESTADALLDWVDADNTPRSMGAELSYYRGRGLPYGPRNAAPSSLEELLLVRDVTRSQLFGGDTNLNYQRDAGDASGDGWGQSTPWASLLTVHSAERNVTPQGQPRIDLNEKDLSKLHSQLTRALDRRWADFVVLYRQHGLFATQAPEEDATEGEVGRRGASLPSRRGGSLDPMEQEANASANDGPVRIEIDLSKAGSNRLRSPLDLVGAVVRVPLDQAAPSSDGRSTARLARRDESDNQAAATNNEDSEKRFGYVTSPLQATSEGLRDELPRLLDYATTHAEPIIRGRINMRFAPRAVLAAVPGLPETAIERILAAQREEVGPDSERRHPTWLLSEGLVDLDEMKRLVLALTTGGEVYRAQVVGFLDQGGAYCRVEVVIDATQEPPRQVYYKDLTPLGLGFGPRVLGAGDLGELDRGALDGTMSDPMAGGAGVLDDLGGGPSGLGRRDTPGMAGFASDGSGSDGQFQPFGQTSMAGTGRDQDGYDFRAVDDVRGQRHLMELDVGDASGRGEGRRIVSELDVSLTPPGGGEAAEGAEQDDAEASRTRRSRQTAPRPRGGEGRSEAAGRAGRSQFEAFSQGQRGRDATDDVEGGAGPSQRRSRFVGRGERITESSSAAAIQDYLQRRFSGGGASSRPNRSSGGDAGLTPSQRQEELRRLEDDEAAYEYRRRAEGRRGR